MASLPAAPAQGDLGRQSVPRGAAVEWAPYASASAGALLTLGATGRRRPLLLPFLGPPVLAKMR